jgi:hypothetical protein
MTDETRNRYPVARHVRAMMCSGLIAWTAGACAADDMLLLNDPEPAMDVMRAESSPPVESPKGSPVEPLRAADAPEVVRAERQRAIRESGSSRPARCPGSAGAIPCDITESTCHRALFDLAKCLRGTSDAPLPPIEVLSDEEFTRRLSTPEEEAEVDPHAAAAQAQMTRVRAMLRLQRDEPKKAQADDHVARTAAIYDTRGDYVWVRRDAETTSISANSTLLHELIHALQDAEHDLLAVLSERRSYDEQLTKIGLVEGEAMVYELLGIEELRGRDLDWDDVLESLRNELDAGYRSSRNPIVAARMSYPYSYGARYVADVFFEGGADAVRGLLDQDLVSSDLMRHAVGERQVEHGPPVGAPEPDEALEPLVRNDSLGAFLHFGLFPGSDANAFDAALSLSTDRFDVYVTGDEQPVAVWQHRWTAPEGQRAFRDFTRELEPGTFELRESDGVTTLIATDDPEALQSWLANEY